MAEAVGANVEAGVGIEATEGTAVRAQVLLDTRTWGLAGMDEKIFSRALRGRLPRRVVVGAAHAEGSLVFEVTPAKFSKVLVGAFGNPSTVGVADPFTHTFTPRTAESKPLTFYAAKKDLAASFQSFHVVHGAHINRMVFAQGLNDMLVATLDVMGMSETLYDSTETLKDAGAGYDTDNPFHFTNLVWELPDATTNTDCDNWSWTFTNEVARKQVMRASRFPIKHLSTGMTISGAFDLYFASITEYRAFWGDSGSAFPTRSKTTVVTRTIKMTWTSATNRTLAIRGPVVVTALDVPVDGPGPIKQRVAVTGYYDGTTETTLVLINGEAAATVTGTGTSITNQPN